MNWFGRLKAVTFSFDDGVTQDERLIRLLDKYGLKATFNLNSGLFGVQNALNIGGKSVRHDKISECKVRTVYHGHEVAAHTLTHERLPLLETQGDTGEIIRQVECDRTALSALCGCKVTGMAYPCGGENNTPGVANIIRENTGIRYARTIRSSYCFHLPDDLYRLDPTVHQTETETLLRLTDEFLTIRADHPMLFYIWGHSYEFDAYDSWDQFETFLKRIGGRKDVFYGTNREVLGL